MHVLYWLGKPEQPYMSCTYVNLSLSVSLSVHLFITWYCTKCSANGVSLTASSNFEGMFYAVFCIPPFNKSNILWQNQQVDNYA